MRPQPICATRILLLGASFPSNRAGIISGAPNAALAASEVFKKLLRFIEVFISISPVQNLHTKNAFVVRPVRAHLCPHRAASRHALQTHASAVRTSQLPTFGKILVPN